MASIDIPAARDLMPSVVKAIRHHRGVATNQQIAAFVVEDLGLGPDQISLFHDEVAGRGRTELEYRLAWARTKLKAKGVVERVSSNVWAEITLEHSG